MNKPSHQFIPYRPHKKRNKVVLPCSAPRQSAGLSCQFLRARKQNIVTSNYNYRKSRLEEITLQNKKIYMRINSQKTSYSRADLSKSYEQKSQISRRLSSSRTSSKSSSRSSIRSSQMKRNPLQQKKVKKYQIQMKSIASIKQHQLSNFNNLFEKRKIQRKLGLNDIRESSILLPGVKRTMPAKVHPFSYRMPEREKANGDMLHKIVEQMYGVNKTKKNKTIL